MTGINWNNCAGRVHLITEFIQGGELYYKIVQNGVYTEAKAMKIFKQLALAIQHMVRKCFDFISRKSYFHFHFKSITSATFIAMSKVRLVTYFHLLSRMTQVSLRARDSRECAGDFRGAREAGRLRL